MGRVSAPTGPALSARGARVLVRPGTQADLPAYRLAVQGSAQRLSRWNAVDPDDLARHLGAQSDQHRTFLVMALDAAGGHGVVGKINVTNVVRGRFASATLGYDAYDPYVGRGLFAEGLRLVVTLALRRAADGGLGLHRVEANVQPGNVRSAGVLRSLGFRHEGETPRMLHLAARGPGADGTEAWRDHERYAVTREEWPAPPFAPHRRSRRVLLVNGLPGAGKTTLARALAAELALPLLAKDDVKEQVGERLPDDVLAGLAGPGSPLGAGAMEALWSVLTRCPTGAVVESWFDTASRGHVDAGLRRAGVDPASVVEVWCDVPAALARARYEARDRSRVHGPQVGLSWWDGDGPARASPLGLGPVLRVDTAGPLGARDVAFVALQARALTVARWAAAAGVGRGCQAP